ncbi:GntR family transcriptional regulator [Bradyrhizobium manausense]
MAGKFAPGERITLRTLASAIGTSPMPVRDALRQLMVDQAIELLPNRTFRIPLMNRSRFLELRDIRVNLEGMAVERAAKEIRRDELYEAAQYSANFNRECDASSPDPGELIVFNKNFHFTIYRAARMPVLLQMIEGLWLQIGPVLNYDVRSGSERISKRIPCEHHERLLQALRAGDGEEAKQALAADLNSACAYILAQNRLPN